MRHKTRSQSILREERKRGHESLSLGFSARSSLLLSYIGSLLHTWIILFCFFSSLRPLIAFYRRPFCFVIVFCFFLPSLSLSLCIPLSISFRFCYWSLLCIAHYRLVCICCHFSYKIKKQQFCGERKHIFLIAFRFFSFHF